MLDKILFACVCVGLVGCDVYFKPRSIEKPVYYAKDNEYKTEVLFPGNYYQISKEKTDEFRPQAIPLLRGFDKRSLEEQPAIPLRGYEKRSLEDEQPNADEAYSLMKRSISYILGGGDDDENEADDDEDYDKDDFTEGDRGSHIKKKIRKRVKKYSKYMMPLLLAYKLKYFALVPVMIAGLVLLVGATGMAGFFFALFAAVMGLQKGGY
ncbi:uncharacterized protein LOC121737864 [Aricia agestis]|uniref:uncharacterized protein LOC121737864 n=1 Tax=Aricia agestis TaxID=91739 RepID=UPI001C206990|nr:uncharacterized protein LOC121737864 [Aricia agestis]